MFEPTLTWMVESVRWEWAFAFSLSDPLAIFSEIWEWWLINELTTVEENIEETNNEINLVKVEKEVVALLSEDEKQNTLINCLNNDECDMIEPQLMESMKFLRVFMMMNYLWWEKMSFDQKVLLRSINEFINKTPWGLTNWTLTTITFGEPSMLDDQYKIKALDITLNMEFDHKRNLISFLKNIEDKVFKELPVLYVIESLNYDIVNYTERQWVNIAATVYYFDGQPPQPKELEIDE